MKSRWHAIKFAAKLSQMEIRCNKMAEEHAEATGEVYAYKANLGRSMQANQELKKDIAVKDAKIEAQKEKIAHYKKEKQQHEVVDTHYGLLQEEKAALEQKVKDLEKQIKSQPMVSFSV